MQCPKCNYETPEYVTICPKCGYGEAPTEDDLPPAAPTLPMGQSANDQAPVTPTPNNKIDPLTTRFLLPTDQFSDVGGQTHAPTRQVQQRTLATQGAFLAAYAKTCRVNVAAESAGIARQTHYDWLKNDPEYRAMYAEAEVLAVQSLEDEAVSRAVDGWEEPVFQGGVKVGTVTKKSERLLELLLKGKKPTTYRERSDVNVSGEMNQKHVHTIGGSDPLDAFTSGILSLVRAGSSKPTSAETDGPAA